MPIAFPCLVWHEQHPIPSKTSVYHLVMLVYLQPPTKCAPWFLFPTKLCSCGFASASYTHPFLLAKEVNVISNHKPKLVLSRHSPSWWDYEDLVVLDRCGGDQRYHDPLYMDVLVVEPLLSCYEIRLCFLVDTEISALMLCLPKTITSVLFIGFRHMSNRRKTEKVLYNFVI
jgi:hypothetical protein